MALVLLIATSTILYIQKLGFYSDDWAFLATMTTTKDQSIPGLWRGMDENPNLFARPVQILEQAILYSVFDRRPIGYHIANSAVLASAGVFFYLALRELRAPRYVALAVPAVFMLMPSYSPDRFWFAAFGYNTAMAAYGLSLYADLRALSEQEAPMTRVIWKAVALGALIICGLGYEIALPLLASNVAVLYLRWRCDGTKAHPRMRPVILITSLAINVFILLAITAFKAVTAVGVGHETGLMRHVARLLAFASWVQFGSYGIGLPTTVGWALSRVSITTLVLALVLALAITRYLLVVMSDSSDLVLPIRWRTVSLVGLATFGLGYAIFVTTGRFSEASTGIDSRIGIAGALGVSITLVGLIGWIAAGLPQPAGRWFFSSSVGLLIASYFLVLNSLASYWIDAYQEEQEIVHQILSDVPTLPAGATLILAGACPYHGPAVVFESNWDLQGALAMQYDDSTLRADVATPRLTVREDGLHTTIYGEESHYPYGQDLLLYNVQTHRTSTLENKEAALRRRGELSVDPVQNCPAATEGYGALVLPFDRLLREVTNR